MNTPKHPPASTNLAPVPDVAVESGLKPWFLYEMIRQGRLPTGVVVKLGPRTTRINRARWTAFIEEGGLLGVTSK